MTVARAVGVAGLAAYNWWVGVVLVSALLTSPDVLFSDLEVEGYPHAALLSHLDVAAGLLIGLALLLGGRLGRSGPRPEWLLLLGFAAAGVLGGLYSYVCSEGASAACRSAEWHFRLPFRHYVHVGAGITEFAFASIAVLVAYRRRETMAALVARVVRVTGLVLLVAYPLIVVAYLTDRYGAVVEPVFFVCFSAIVAVELFEAAPGQGNEGRTSCVAADRPMGTG